jgi:Tfp pilus assembly protein PilO
MTIPRINFREPQVIVRAVLGVLLLANLITAVFAFHLVGDTPADLDAQLTAVRSNLRGAQTHLNRSRTLTANMDRSREEGDKFLTSYLTSRRHTYSTILDEINKLSGLAGMKIGDYNFALPDPIEGSEDLDMLTLTAHFEGGYPQLMKFVNLVDRSPRFLVIEVLQVAPQPKGDILDVTIKLDSFVKDDKGGAL